MTESGLAAGRPGWAAYLFTSEDRPIGFAFVRALFGPALLNSFFVVRSTHRSRIGMDIKLAVLRPVYEGEIQNLGGSTKGSITRNRAADVGSMLRSVISLWPSASSSTAKAPGSPAATVAR